jgi:hypothetical protein
MVYVERKKSMKAAVSTNNSGFFLFVGVAKPSINTTHVRIYIYIHIHT